MAEQGVAKAGAKAERTDGERAGAPLAAYAMLAGAMLIAGICVTIGKAALVHLPVVALAGARCLAAAAFLAPIAWAEGRRSRSSVGAVLGGMNGRERFDLVAQAFFGIVAFTLLMLGGVRLTGAGEAGLIAATMPLAILVLALPLLGEPLRARPLFAAGIASAGIAVITFAGTPGSQGGEWRWLGNLLVALAVLSEALYTLFAKRLAARLPPATMALLLNAIGLALFAPLLVFQPWGAILRGTPGEAWALGTAYGVLTSGLGLLLWYRGTRHVPGGVAGLFTVFLPIGAIASGIAFLGESIDASEALGGAVIALALVIGLVPARGRRL